MQVKTQERTWTITVPKQKHPWKLIWTEGLSKTLEVCPALVSCLTESRETQTWSQEVCTCGISNLNLRIWTRKSRGSLQPGPCRHHHCNAPDSTRKNLQKMSYMNNNTAMRTNLPTGREGKSHPPARDYIYRLFRYPWHPENIFCYLLIMLGTNMYWALAVFVMLYLALCTYHFSGEGLERKWLKSQVSSARVSTEGMFLALSLLRRSQLFLELHHLTCLHCLLDPSQRSTWVKMLHCRAMVMTAGMTPSPTLGSRTSEASKVLQQTFPAASQWCFLLWLHLTPQSNRIFSLRNTLPWIRGDVAMSAGEKGTFSHVLFS